MLLLIKKQTDVLIEQTKTRPQEILEFKMKKKMPTFSFPSPINLIGEGKWLLGVSSFECTTSVYNITNDNNSFSVIIPGHYKIESDGKTNDEINILFRLKFLELHVKEVRKRGNKKTGDNDYKLSDFDIKNNRDT